MEGEPRMAIEPFAYLRVFMGRIVVEDDMDRFFGWDLSLDLVEKADELLMPMLLHAASDDLAFEHVEGGKHGCGPVRGLSWRIGLRECHHPCRNVRSEWRNARGTCLVAQQTLEALLH